MENCCRGGQGEEEKVPGAPKPPVAPGRGEWRKFGYLFEAHIRPVVSYGIRGVLWDQGESGTAITGVDQFHAMVRLFRGWRTVWDKENFLFYTFKSRVDKVVLGTPTILSPNRLSHSARSQRLCRQQTTVNIANCILKSAPIPTPSW